MQQVHKQWKNEKKYISSGIYKTRYHDDSYLLLIGKWILQSFRISYVELFLLWNKRHPFLNSATQSFKIK